MPKQLIALFICAMLSSLAHAALIQVSADVGWSSGTGNGGFEHNGGPDVERGHINFIYDSSITDMDSRTGSGLYLSAIDSFTMSVRQATRPDLLFSLTSGQNAMVRTLSFADQLAVTITLAEANHAFDTSAFTFNFRICCMGIGFPDEAPTIGNYWSRDVSGLMAGGGGVHETDWLYYMTLRAAVIPEPSAPLLLTIGLLALMSIRRPED